MFRRIGRFVFRHAKAVLVLTFLAMVGGGVLGVDAFDKLRNGGFEDPAAESNRATELIEANFGGQADLMFLVEAESGNVDDPAAAAAGRELTEELTGEPELSNVISYWTTGAPTLKSTDGRYGLVMAHGGDEKLVEGLEERYGGDHSDVTVTIGGSAAANSDIDRQIHRDLLVAEAIAVPLILLLLLFAFRSFVASLLPLAVGGLAILGTFAELSVLGDQTNVSIYAINLTTAMGLGLAIDYALLIVSRFREELSEGSDVEQAVVRTVETAGRTVVFSAATVAAALSVLVLFPLYFLRSFAYAGIGVIAIAAIGAVLVLPALLTLLGTRVNGRSRRTPRTTSRFWGGLSGLVMRHPVLTALPVIAALALAASPLLRVDFGTPDDRVLPTSASSRQVGDVVREEFDAHSTSPIELVTTATPTPAELSAYAVRLSKLDGVQGVQSSIGRFVDGAPAGRSPADEGMIGEDAQRLAVYLTVDPHSRQAQDLVQEVRETPAPGGARVLAGGVTAVMVDSKAAVADRLPMTLLLIVLTTFVVLFLFTGSVVQPIRTLMLNVLTMSATLGALVWIFEEGHLASWLGFTPMPLDTSMLMLLFCIIFGLSMDYEVFIMSRVTEMHYAGADNRASVTNGMARTGRIVATAAVLLAVTFFAFGTASVSFLQMFGIGSGLAVLLDALLVRGVLVPAWMRVFGRVAWYAPRPMRRLHRRVRVAEA